MFMSLRYYPLKVFPVAKYVEKSEKKVRRTIFQNIKDLTNQNSKNQIRKQRLRRFLWNECSWKLGRTLTKAYKGIQCLGKLYIAVMKLLPLKLIPSQVPLTKISNFSNNYVLVHITFSWKSSTRIDRRKFQKMLENTERLLLKPA